MRKSNLATVMSRAMHNLSQHVPAEAQRIQGPGQGRIWGIWGVHGSSPGSRPQISARILAPCSCRNSSPCFCLAHPCIKHKVRGSVGNTRQQLCTKRVCPNPCRNLACWKAANVSKVQQGQRIQGAAASMVSMTLTSRIQGDAASVVSLALTS